MPRLTAAGGRQTVSYARQAMSGLRRSPSLWALAGLGFAGSLLVAYAAPGTIGDPTLSWWYRPTWPSSRGTNLALVYAGMALLAIGWLGLGRLVAGRTWRAPVVAPADQRVPTTGQLLLVAVLWILPLALGPVLYSRDVYSYLAQGTILHLGRNPYHDTPLVLARLGHAHVLAGVSSFWRHTPAPYGPLFLKLMSLIVSVTGSNLVNGALVLRAVELFGIALLAGFVPRLAHALGTDPARAVWLVLLSPVLMLELVSAGHNDVLMIGLLAAGVAVALEGRPLLGIALCALAATIKVPALAGAVFIAVAWARAEPTPRARLGLLLRGGLLTLVVLAAVSLVTGLGASWLSSSVFSTPAKVRLAITPATNVGWTVAALLHDAGVSAASRTIESAFGAVAAAFTAGAGVLLLSRLRVARLAPYLGAFLLTAAAGGPAAWPWYGTWGLVVLAACPGPQRSAGLALAIVASAFLVKPDGILAIPLGAAPAVLAVYAAAAGAAWYHRRRCGSDCGAAPRGSSGLADGTPSALVRT